MSLLFPATPLVTVPIEGSEKRFPVHRVYCVGRNYNDHVKEMGGVVGRDPPFFFMKPADAIVIDGRFPYPALSEDVHHEVELVIAIGEGARIFGHATGLDITRRDLQAVAKKLGRPWETAKSFEHSALIGGIVPSAEELRKGAITLDVNGRRRQTGNIADMIWGVTEIIAELKRFFNLQAGDLIYTGTPAGVAAIARGDRMVAAIEGAGTLVAEVV